MVIRKSLKAGVVPDIDGTEWVNDSVKSKVLDQGVGSGSRGGVDRVRMRGGFGIEGER